MIKTGFNCTSNNYGTSKGRSIFFLDQNEKTGEVNKQRCKKLLQEKQAKKKTYVKKYRNLKQQINKGCLGEMKKSTQSLLGLNF